MTNVVAIVPLNAANFESGAATDGQVLTADGAGNAAWENVAAGGDTVQVGQLVQAVSNPNAAKYLPCNGSSVNRSSWPDLSAVWPTFQPWAFSARTLLTGRTTPYYVPMKFVGGRYFFPVNSSDKMPTSVNGVDWAEATMPSSAVWSSVAWNGTIYCAIATNGTKSAISNDGLAWTAKTMPISSYWSEIASNGAGQFVALRGSNHLTNLAYYSTDGINWSTATLPFTSSWHRILWNGTRYVASSIIGKIAISANGIDWTTAAELPAMVNWHLLACEGTLCVAVSTSTITINQEATLIGYMSSDSGATWTSFTKGPDISDMYPNGDYWYGLAISNGNIFITGQRQSYWTIDTITWGRNKYSTAYASVAGSDGSTAFFYTSSGSVTVIYFVPSDGSTKIYLPNRLTSFDGPMLDYIRAVT